MTERHGRDPREWRGVRRAAVAVGRPRGVIETKLIPPALRPGTVARGESSGSADCCEGDRRLSAFSRPRAMARRRFSRSRSRASSDRSPGCRWMKATTILWCCCHTLRSRSTGVLPLTPALFAMLSSPGPFEPSAMHRVCSELSTLPEHVLVLDDVQLVSGAFSRDAIAALALHVGQGSQIVLSGRSSDGLPIARLRATGRLLEIGAADLALDDGRDSRGARARRRERCC